MGEADVNKEQLKQLKEWVDVTIDFLKLVSKYLGNAVAAILFPWQKK